MPLLSVFSSFISGVLTLVVIFIRVTTFLLRAVAVMTPMAANQIGKRQDSTSQVLLIDEVLVANKWYLERPIDQDKGSLLRKKLDSHIDEELAAIRGDKERRGTGEGS